MINDKHFQSIFPTLVQVCVLALVCVLLSLYLHGVAAEEAEYCVLKQSELPSVFVLVLVLHTEP